ncbi:MAG: response regulator [Chloroflexota bacterium]
MSWSVLIVDDEQGTRELLRLMLEFAGYDIYEAVDGLDALEKVKLVQPDVILLDVMMPNLDGLEVCRRLRSQPATAKLPIIMVSAKIQVEAIREGLAAGATRYLTKPVSRANLVETIREVVTPLFTV